MPEKEKEITNYIAFRQDIISSNELNDILYLVPLMYKVLTDREVIPFNKKAAPLIESALETDKLHASRHLKYFNSLKTEEFIEVLDTLLEERGKSSSSEASSEMSSRGISALVYKLLDIQDGDTFYDLGSGYGALLTNIYGIAKSEDKNLSYIGTDIDETALTYCEMILSIYSLGKASLTLFEGDANIENINGYNKGYTYPPIGERFFSKKVIHNSRLYPDVDMAGRFYEQWVYIDSLLSGLSGDSPRACAFVTGKSLLATDTNMYLQRLLSEGWIEGIIELPSLSMSVASQLFILVFSKGNSKVKSLNCKSDKFVAHERGEIMANGVRTGYKYQDINTNLIYRAYTEEANPYLQFISNSDLKDKINWHPSSLIYSVKSQNNDNYVPLREVCAISSGLPSTLRDFTLSDDDTGYKILTSSDISDTMIKWNELHNVEPFKKVNEKYFLHAGDVVISLKSTKVKVAVIDRDPIDKLILTGGMIKIVTDPNRLNPYYLKMFLDSEEGMRALESISGGTSIIHISPALLSSLKVPVISLDAQKDKAGVYQLLIEQMSDYQLKLKMLEEEVNSLINKKD